MISSAEKMARKVGRIDALLFFLVWAAIGLVAATSPVGALPMIVLVLIPASALVGWRGAASTRLILSGKSTFKRAALEGFAWGAGFAFAVWLWALSNFAFAAGTVFTGLSPFELQFWLTVVTSLVPVLIIAGSFGALTGVVLLFINRWLVRANPPLNTDAPTSGAPVS